MAGQNPIGNAFARVIEPHDGEPVDSVGVPNRVHYLMLAIFAFAVAAGPIGFSLAPGGEELRNPLTLGLCAGGVIFSPFILFVGRSTNYVFADWIFQAALFFLLAGTFLSNLVTPHMIAPFMTLYMLAPVGAAFYLPMRKVVPFAVGSVAAILFMSTRVPDDPDALLRGVVTSIVGLATAYAAAAMRSSLARTVRHNREISELDPLTGVHNMHKFEERLAEEMARAERGGPGFALVMFDLDNFKQVNDSFNHSTGDEVLVASAKAIASQLSAADLLVRRGGDEFAVIMPSSNNRNPRLVIEAIRKRVERARREICPNLTPYSSAGFTEFRPGETRDELLKRADAALHDAKAQAPERRGHHADEPTPIGTSTSLGADRAIDKLRLHDDPIRELMVVLYRASAVVIVGVSATFGIALLVGRLPLDHPVPGVSAVAIWFLVFVPLTLRTLRRSHLPAYAQHVLPLAVLLLLVAGSASLGRHAPLFVDTFMFAALMLVALLSFSRAFVYLVAAMVLYGAFLFASKFPYAEIRLTIAGGSFLLTALVLSVVRHGTIVAAREKARLARTDALTGLPNMRRLRDRLSDEIRRCEATGDGFALLMLDLDEFKQVNDIHGHSVGDRVLIDVATAIQDVCRHADMPARRGGDEFAVVMTDAEADDAEHAARRIADAIQIARLTAVADVNPNASVGWTVWSHGQTVDDLIGAADVALHEAKRRARQSYLRADAG